MKKVLAIVLALVLALSLFGCDNRNTQSQTSSNIESSSDIESELSLSQEEKEAYAAAFKRNPGKYKTLRGYMLAKEYAKLGE